MRRGTACKAADMTGRAVAQCCPGWEAPWRRQYPGLVSSPAGTVKPTAEPLPGAGERGFREWRPRGLARRWGVHLPSRTTERWRPQGGSRRAGPRPARQPGTGRAARLRGRRPANAAAAGAGRLRRCRRAGPGGRAEGFAGGRGRPAAGRPPAAGRKPKPPQVTLWAWVTARAHAAASRRFRTTKGLVTSWGERTRSPKACLPGAPLLLPSPPPGPTSAPPSRSQSLGPPPPPPVAPAPRSPQPELLEATLASRPHCLCSRRPAKPQ